MARRPTTFAGAFAAAFCASLKAPRSRGAGAIKVAGRPTKSDLRRIAAKGKAAAARRSRDG